ncbi:MAG TPA: Hsp20/alpha crystallin family protein [Pyrinomonadaceae bacterium]
MPNPDREFSMMQVGRRVRPSGKLWNPSADVYKTTEGWTVKVDLAGVCSDELELEVADTSLSIRGCRRDTMYREDFRYHQMEITYSRFEKTIKFPCEIESASVSHDYRDGFLIVTLKCE